MQLTGPIFGRRFDDRNVNKNQNSCTILTNKYAFFALVISLDPVPLRTEQTQRLHQIALNIEHRIYETNDAKINTFSE